MDWVKAHQEAHRLEHAISAEVEERLAKLLNHPATCPHGNAIPGMENSRGAKKSAPLAVIAQGREVVLQRITEGGERDSRLLGFMQDHQLVPGAKVTVLEVAPSLGVMSLKVGREEFALGIEAAKKLRVLDA